MARRRKSQGKLKDKPNDNTNDGCAGIPSDVLMTLDECLESMKTINEIIFDTTESTNKITCPDCQDFITELMAGLLNIQDMATMGRLEIMSLLDKDVNMSNHYISKTTRDMR